MALIYSPCVYSLLRVREENLTIILPLLALNGSLGVSINKYCLLKLRLHWSYLGTYKGKFKSIIDP